MIITVKSSLKFTIIALIAAAYRSPFTIIAFVEFQLVIEYIFVYNDIRCKDRVCITI